MLGIIARTIWGNGQVPFLSRTERVTSAMALLMPYAAFYLRALRTSPRRTWTSTGRLTCGSGKRLAAMPRRGPRGDSQVGTGNQDNRLKCEVAGFKGWREVKFFAGKNPVAEGLFLVHQINHYQQWHFHLVKHKIQ